MENPFALHQPEPKISCERVPQNSTIAGLHIVANFEVSDRRKLNEFEPFRAFIEQEIKRFNLTSVGEVYHNFPNGGYTGVVCLTESHLSIHTWPERNYLTFDVFLSNYLKDNRPTTHSLYTSVKTFFDATILYEKILNR